jgi:hypothetical protein
MFASFLFEHKRGEHRMTTAAIEEPDVRARRKRHDHEDRIARDGETVRASIMVVDSAMRAHMPHRGYGIVQGHDRKACDSLDAAYDASDRALADRWRKPRTPAPLGSPAAHLLKTCSEDGDALDQARQRYHSQLADRWRTTRTALPSEQATDSRKPLPMTWPKRAIRVLPDPTKPVLATTGQQTATVAAYNSYDAKMQSRWAKGGAQ